MFGFVGPRGLNFVKSQIVKLIESKKKCFKNIRQQSIYQQQTEFEKFKFNFQKKKSKINRQKN